MKRNRSATAASAIAIAVGLAVAVPHHLVPHAHAAFESEADGADPVELTADEKDIIKCAIDQIHNETLRDLLTKALEGDENEADDGDNNNDDNPANIRICKNASDDADWWGLISGDGRASADADLFIINPSIITKEEPRFSYLIDTLAHEAVHATQTIDPDQSEDDNRNRLEWEAWAESIRQLEKRLENEDLQLTEDQRQAIADVLDDAREARDEFCRNVPQPERTENNATNDRTDTPSKAREDTFYTSDNDGSIAGIDNAVLVTDTNANILQVLEGPSSPIVDLELLPLQDGNGNTAGELLIAAGLDGDILVYHDDNNDGIPNAPLPVGINFGSSQQFHKLKGLVTLDELINPALRNAIVVLAEAVNPDTGQAELTEVQAFDLTGVTDLPDGTQIPPIPLANSDQLDGLLGLNTIHLADPQNGILGLSERGPLNSIVTPDTRAGRLFLAPSFDIPPEFTPGTVGDTLNEPLRFLLPPLEGDTDITVSGNPGTLVQVGIEASGNVDIVGEATITDDRQATIPLPEPLFPGSRVLIGAPIAPDELNPSRQTLPRQPRIVEFQPSVPLQGQAVTIVGDNFFSDETSGPPSVVVLGKPLTVLDAFRDHDRDFIIVEWPPLPGPQPLFSDPPPFADIRIQDAFGIPPLLPPDLTLPPVGIPAGADCNRDGIPDFGQLNPSTDSNGNGVLDVCEQSPPPCPEDLNGDGVIDNDDIFLVLLAEGTFPGDDDYNPDADLNGDGLIDTRDVFLVLDRFGEICPTQTVTVPPPGPVPSFQPPVAPIPDGPFGPGPLPQPIEFPVELVEPTQRDLDPLNPNDPATIPAIINLGLAYDFTPSELGEQLGVRLIQPEPDIPNQTVFIREFRDQPIEQATVSGFNLTGAGLWPFVNIGGVALPNPLDPDSPVGPLFAQAILVNNGAPLNTGLAQTLEPDFGVSFQLVLETPANAVVQLEQIAPQPRANQTNTARAASANNNNAGTITLSYADTTTGPDGVAAAYNVILIPRTSLCPGNTNFDVGVNAADLLLVLNNFGADTAPGFDGDVAPADHPDGNVNAADLLLVLNNLGVTCP